MIVHNYTTIIVDRRTLELLDDIPTRTAVEKFGAAALNSPGVEAVKFEEVGDGDVTEEVRLVKADLPPSFTPSPSGPPMVERVEREVLLKIITSAFRDGYKWRFSDGGEKPVLADVEDIDFLNAVMEGNISLAANDTLRCLVLEEQTLDGGVLRKETKV